MFHKFDADRIDLLSIFDVCIIINTVLCCVDTLEKILVYAHWNLGFSRRSLGKGDSPYDR